MSRVERIGDAELWLGDCREILPRFGRVDAVVTDPPYGVGLTGKSAHSSGRRNIQHTKRTDTYASFVDDDANFRGVVVPALTSAIGNGTGLVFCSGSRLPDLPPYKALGGIFLPAGTGASQWGFQCFMHCALYGPDPYLAKGLGGRPNGKYGIWGNDANTIDHPCAKPIDAMMWAVERASLAGHTILDPFMGSGTTGVACARLGRKFIGIEIEAKYFDIAVRRIEHAQRQKDLFVHAPVPIDPAEQRAIDFFAEPEA